MRISELTLKEFRNFENETIKFHPNFTVVIGNNGTGKTTVLKGLRVALGSYLGNLPLILGAKQGHPFSKGDRRVWWDNEKKDFISAIITNSSANPSVSVSGEVENFKAISWKRYYSVKGTSQLVAKESNTLNKYILTLVDCYKNNKEVVMPVLANFSTNRFDAQVKKIDKTWLTYSNVEKGYYASLDNSTNPSSVNEWLFNYDDDLINGRVFEGSREAVYEAIKTAIPYVELIEFNRRYQELQIVINFLDGQSIERKLLSNCSDGVRAMVNMVAEIAFRSVMLNGRFGKEAVRKSSGIVLIDELDMLLHSNWQRHIVSDLIAAFPQMQFVATTHSPFIVQSLETSMLWNLERVVDVDISKLGLAEVATAVMGVESAYSEKSEQIFQKMVNPKPTDELPSDALARAFHVLTQSGK